MTGHAERGGTAPEPLVYSVEQAADLLGIGRTFMFRLVITGEIESFKIGNRRKITREALDEFIGRLLREQEPTGSDRDRPRQPGDRGPIGRH